MNLTTKNHLKKQCERVWKSMKEAEKFITKDQNMNCTIQNAALFLGVTPRTIRNYIKDWMLEVIKITRPGMQQPLIRITTESLNKLVEHSTTKQEHIADDAAKS